jgi:DNA-binding MarR family transcriptional regulator
MTERTQLIDSLLREFDSLNGRVAEFSGPDFLGIDITMAQAKLLFLVRGRGSVPMSDLVARLGVSVPTVTGIVDRLVERDLVVRRGTPEDRRRVVIEITRAGVDLIDGMREFNQRQVRTLLGVLDDDELRTFHAFLVVMQRGIARLVEQATAAAPVEEVAR